MRYASLSPAASAHLRRVLPITVCVVGMSKKGISLPLGFGNHRLASSERGIITGFSVFCISISMYSPFPSAVLKMCIGARRYMSLNRNPVKQAKMKASLDLWAVTIRSYEGAKFLYSKVFFLAFLGLDALTCIKFLHRIVSDNALAHSVIESSGEHSEVSACCILADRSWLAILDMGVWEVTQELHISTAELRIDPLQEK